MEDDPLTARILTKSLQTPRRKVIVTATLALAEKALQESDFTFILLDLQLPDGDGREILSKVRTRPATVGTPVFVVSSQDGQQIQTECFALGADAYFLKPFNPKTLVTAINSKLWRIETALPATTIDSLTGLPNRTAFRNGFHRAAMLASRSGEPLTVAMLDVDRFKSVNDLYGHLEGDKVLRSLASVVSESLRASDLLARWGGEEFAVLFPNTTMAEARLALTKALDAFRAQGFITGDGRPFQVTFSAGIAQVKRGAGIDKAMAQADRFLYLAKASGRDHVLTPSDRVSLKKNVLVVEDNDVTAAIITRYLKRDGLQVIHAKASDDALAAAAAQPISLISLDVKIPGLDGFELLKRFRMIPALQQIPIIMVTSSAKQEDIVRGFELGADDYILKPFSPREFLARVQRFLQKEAR